MRNLVELRRADAGHADFTWPDDNFCYSAGAALPAALIKSGWGDRPCDRVCNSRRGAAPEWSRKAKSSPQGEPSAQRTVAPGAF